MIWLISTIYEIPIRKLTADPAQIYDGPFYGGFLSNLNILVWAWGAFACWFTFWFLTENGGEGEWIRFFRLAAILTTVLMLDDLYMFHEEVFPHYLFLPWITGLEPNEKFVICGYGIFTLWFLYTSRNTIRKTAWVHLLVACAILGAGVLADRGIAKQIFTDSKVRAFIEDATKFVGVVGWSLYFSGTGRALIRSMVQRASAAEVTPDSNQPV